MRLEHEFTVPVPIEQAWDVLLDVERVAPCMPGATVESVDGDTFTGRVKVRVGPVTVSYTGTASFLEKDAVARRVVVQAKGRETRGAGTAAATVMAVLRDVDGDTSVNVATDLAITGRPAQFGRGVMEDVGAKLLGQFADCLAERLGAEEPRRPTSDTINLVEVAGGSIAKRVGPVLAVLAGVVIVWIVVRGLRG